MTRYIRCRGVRQKKEIYHEIRSDHSLSGSVHDSVSVTEIVLNGFSIKTSPIVTCLGVKIDAELTFSTPVKQVAARCFYQLRQLWSIRPALTIMLTHALIVSRVDYCNSVLFQTAALRPLQSVMNAAACLVVKKRKFDSITPTLRDCSTLAPGSSTNRLQALSSHLQMSPPACRTVPRVNDLSSFGSVNTSPPTVGRSR